MLTKISKHFQLVNEGLAIHENQIVEVARAESEHSDENDIFSACGSSVISGQADFIQDLSDEEDDTVKILPHI